jgi:stage II sporulation protein D
MMASIHPLTNDSLAYYESGCQHSRKWHCGGILLLLMLAQLLTAYKATAQQEIRFGVLGLFHPKVLVLQIEGRQVLCISARSGTADSAYILNGEPGHQKVTFRVKNGQVDVEYRMATGWTATARDGKAAAFQLMVPGKFHRIYNGRLSIQAHNGELLAVVTMDRETAVASIVAAEMNERAPMEALKAQAVATRSFLSAGARHSDFDFCDTTHCQFLKSPPSLSSRVFSAVQATRGFVIAYRGKSLAAMYSSRCGGQTRSLRDVGMEPGEGYPYFAVQCAWCRQHPFTWNSLVRKSSKPPVRNEESNRIMEARQWGWSAIPGSDFTATDDRDKWKLEGHSIGHGVGMCQLGAIGMAVTGASFREILSHYYPNTMLIQLP